MASSLLGPTKQGRMLSVGRKTNTKAGQSCVVFGCQSAYLCSSQILQQLMWLVNKASAKEGEVISEMCCLSALEWKSAEHSLNMAHGWLPTQHEVILLNSSFKIRSITWGSSVKQLPINILTVYTFLRYFNTYFSAVYSIFKERFGDYDLMGH